MSCLDVMYHQSYGAHRYLPATSAAAAAAAYKAAYYHHHHHHHHHHQQQQQKKLGAYGKMQDPAHPQGKPPQRRSPVPESAEEAGEGAASRGREAQPAEAEYISSRCVLFTYFQGSIGDVVDEHFSRALSQPSAFTGETKPARPWKDGGSLEGPPSLWNTGYPPQASSCLSSIHPDFPAGAAFHPADTTGLWSSHGLPESGLSDSWHYGLGPQGSGGYPHVHGVYPHVHSRHAHPHHHMLHHGPALDPRFSPLLLPGARPACSPTAHADMAKMELEPGGAAASSWQASFHGSVDVFDTDQDKTKAAVWF
ncbi:transcription cofactor vestigial-like protein 3 [Denticeps clupeoides]|uniref:transcription cofactor vestigial-like protein 3 n=1 Tax=Denticeps clupeoides TaxID=299321 RepID=UPI0010A509E0|nr:transcription cofactor vestigial-like protein 3 [Denticeps clupeoides]